VLRGWHVLRHSFASNAALKGVDQRMINSWLGHQTEEMVQRYRHLYPDQERQAISAVFGPAGKAQAS
jgi:site-specific recombinase XerD